jgi:hypothetical protein
LKEDPIPAQNPQYVSLRTGSGLVELDPAVESFETVLHHQLQAHSVRYCVLSNDARSAEDPTDPLDMAVHSEDCGELLRVICVLGEKEYRAVQVENPAAGISRFHFASMRCSTPSFRVLEVLTGSTANPLLRSADEIVAHRRKRRGIWVAAAADEYRYLLIKSTLRGSCSHAQEQRLRQLASGLGTNQASALIRELFGKRWQARILASCLAGCANDLFASANKKLRVKHCVRYPWWPVLSALESTRTFLRRWFQPPGLLVVLLGQVIKPRKKYPFVFASPHSEPPHGTLESIARLIAVLIDYWVGQIALIKPLLMRSALVIYDRDFHDILVDTYRYRYGGPRSLLSIAKQLVPRGECIFLTLEADPEIILQRKQEVDPEEVQRQCISYRQLAAGLPNSHVIRTDREFDQTLAEISGVLVNYLGNRLQRRHGLPETCP